MGLPRSSVKSPVCMNPAEVAAKNGIANKGNENKHNKTNTETRRRLGRVDPGGTLMPSVR